VAPLAVWAGLNEPQFELVQLTIQSTPRFAESLVTVALIVAVVLVCKEAGGALVKVMDTDGPAANCCAWKRPTPCPLASTSVSITLELSTT